MYPENIILSSNPSTDFASLLNENDYTSITLLVDENTEQLCLPLLVRAFDGLNKITIKPGEDSKSLATCDYIWSEMSKFNLDRSSLLINIGGGIICDIGGFCASTYKRGIDFINIPTTLLAMVDASFGGKTGFNFYGLKNQIGTFAEPLTTVIHPGFLHTLDLRQIKSGFAEVLKHAIIADAGIFEILAEANLEAMDWDGIISSSISIKNSIVEKDPFEEGFRKSLNFGHTIGHALELTLPEVGVEVLHGEAVAAGILAESFISSQKLDLAQPEMARIKAAIMNHFGILELNSDLIPQIISRIKGDKKNKAGKTLMTLIPKIGSVEVNLEVSDSEIEAGLTYYQSLSLRK